MWLLFLIREIEKRIKMSRTSCWCSVLLAFGFVVCVFPHPPLQISVLAGLVTKGAVRGLKPVGFRWSHCIWYLTQWAEHRSGTQQYQLYSQLRFLAWSNDFIFSYFSFCKLVKRLCCKGVKGVTDAGKWCLGTVLTRAKQFPPLTGTAFQLCVQTITLCRASALANVIMVNLLYFIRSGEKHCVTDPGFGLCKTTPQRRVGRRVISLSGRLLGKNL